MLKNKLKLIIALVTALIMLFAYSTCFAVDEPVSNVEGNEKDALKSDLYLLEENDVTIDYTVDGNAFIIAQTVTITSEIGGDAFIIADTINIDGGYIYSNLFALANTININGIVYDLYACSSAITVGNEGYVYRDVHSVSESLNILGAVGRNVSTECNQLSFTSADDVSSHGTIYGNLEYSSGTEIAIEDGYVEGDVTFNQEITTQPESNTTVSTYLSDLAIYVITALVVYLLIIWLIPKFSNTSKELLANKILSVIGFGLLGLFIIPVASIILMILGVTVNIALALLALYIMLLLIASAVFVIALAKIIAEKLKLDNKWNVLGIVICTAVAIWAIELIPYIGGLVSFATVVLGLGLMIKHSIPDKTNNVETNNITK